MRGCLGLLPAIVVFLAGCREGSAPSGDEMMPNQIVEGFELQESSSGKRLYTLEAERALVYESEQRIDVKRPRVLFYDEAGKVHSRLVADAGAIFTRTEDLVAKGNVRVETEDSTVLVTDSLAWSNTRRVVRTDAAVEIETPKGRVTGQGLRSDAGLDRIEILSEVRGTSTYRFQP